MDTVGRPTPETRMAALPHKQELFCRLLSMDEPIFDAFKTAGYSTASSGWKANATNLARQEVIKRRVAWIKEHGLEEDDFVGDDLRMVIMGKMGALQDLPVAWLMEQAILNMALCRTHGDTRGANTALMVLVDLRGLGAVPAPIGRPRKNGEAAPSRDETRAALEHTEEKIDARQSRYEDADKAAELDSALERVLGGDRAVDEAPPAGADQAGDADVSIEPLPDERHPEVTQGSGGGGD